MGSREIDFSEEFTFTLNDKEVTGTVTPFVAPSPSDVRVLFDSVEVGVIQDLHVDFVEKKVSVEWIFFEMLPMEKRPAEVTLVFHLEQGEIGKMRFDVYNCSKYDMKIDLEEMVIEGNIIFDYAGCTYIKTGEKTGQDINIHNPVFLAALEFEEKKTCNCNCKYCG